MEIATGLLSVAGIIYFFVTGSLMLIFYAAVFGSIINFIVIFRAAHRKGLSRRGKSSSLFYPALDNNVSDKSFFKGVELKPLAVAYICSFLFSHAGNF